MGEMVEGRINGVESEDSTGLAPPLSCLTWVCGSGADGGRLLRRGYGRFRGDFAMVDFFVQSRGLAGAVSQEVEAGSPDMAGTQNFNSGTSPNGNCTFDSGTNGAATGMVAGKPITSISPIVSATSRVMPQSRASFAQA